MNEINRYNPKNVVFYISIQSITEALNGNDHVLLILIIINI